MKKVLFFSLLWFGGIKILLSQGFFWDKIAINHYDIYLDVTDIPSKVISGYTTITTISNFNGLDSAHFYLSQLQIDSIQYNGTRIFSFIHHNDSIVKIALPQVQNVNDTFLITVYYHGQPILDQSGFGGFYFSSDNLYAYNLGVAFSDDPHSYGRVWFPCIDSFTHKALYDLYITTITPMYAVCGGTMISKTQDTINGTTLTHWKINQKTPPYLVSIAVSDYVLVTDTFMSTAGNIPVHIYVRQPDSVKVAGSFANLNDLLVGFEQHFGTYGWDRVGYVGVPFNYGAMEHAMNIAYPRFAINGNLSYESLVAHELAHSWFGNLVTCASAPEMWINEGWARFAEIIYTEILYGTEEARSYYRNQHKNVLHKTHITDHGYKAVHGVSHDFTYGSTVYDKGGVVINAMRHYMGDSVFFETVRAYTDFFKYQSVTSLDVRNFFSMYSGINMTAFFDTWIFRPGFVTVVADSFRVEQSGQNYEISVWFRQKLKGTTEYSEHNKFEILFLGENFEQQTEVVSFNGPASLKEFVLSFNPVAILIDPLDKTSFATTRDDVMIREPGTRDFSYGMCRLEVINPAADSVRMFLRHHWVPADGAHSSQIFRKSDYRYWEIDGNIPENAQISLRLQYNRSASSSGNLDNSLLTTNSSADSLVLIYRPDASVQWEIIPFTKTGNAITGFVTTPKLMAGQYAFGVGEPNQSNIHMYEPSKQNIMKVFPNPSNGHFTIEFDTDCPQPSIRIFNSMGKQIECTKPQQGKNSVTWNPAQNPAGMYIIQLHDLRRKKMIDSKSVIYEK